MRKVVNVETRTDSVEDFGTDKTPQGSRFDSLSDLSEDTMEQHVGQEGAAVPMRPGQHQKHVTMRVRDSRARKNTQMGSRGKENHNSNVAQHKKGAQKPNQKSGVATKSTNESMIRILKRDTPSYSGPILTPVYPPPDQVVGGPAPSHEDKQRMVKEEQLMLDRMRALTKANSGVGLEGMLWTGPSPTRPPDHREAQAQHESRIDMQHDCQEKILLNPSNVQIGLSQPTSNPRC